MKVIDKKPEYTEVIDKPLFQARLKQIGARIHPEYSTPERHLYAATRMHAWVIAEVVGGKVQLSYYGSCPCDL